jgi:hypothetical protein
VTTAIIVADDSGRGVVKTALAWGLIAALPEFRWTAVRIASLRAPSLVVRNWSGARTRPGWKPPSRSGVSVKNSIQHRSGGIPWTGETF